MNLTLNHLVSAIKGSGVPSQYMREILVILFNVENLTIQKLIQMSRLPRSLVVKILKSLQMFLEPPSEQVRMKPEAIEIILQYLGEAHPDYLQRYDWVPLKEIDEKLESFVREMIAKRAPPKRSLDQFDATLETVLRRVEFLEREVALVGTKILFLGDYDLTSLAVAMRGGPKEINVIDIDGELLSLIQRVSEEWQFPITTTQQDLRLDFPKELLASFNVVFTDPPFTLNGSKLFLLHGIKALAPNGTIYCCFGYSLNNLIVGSQFQEVLNELGLVARTILENFNVYSKAQSIGSTSHLFKLKPTNIPVKLKPFQIGHPIYSGYRENEDLAELIGTVRFRLIEDDLIARLVEELLQPGPKSVAFLNAPLGPLERHLVANGVSLKCIEIEATAGEGSCLPENAKIEFIYPPSTNLKTGYESLVVESPCFNLDSLPEWIRFKSCKNIYLMLPDQMEKIFQSLTNVEVSLWTRTYLSLFWTWNFVLTAPPKAFEPHFGQPAQLYKGTFLRKEAMLTQPEGYILRELIEQPTKMVLNALREAVIRFHEKIGTKFTKNQSKEFIESWELPAELLHLRVQQLSDDELGMVIEGLSKNLGLLKAVRAITNETED